MPRGYRLFFVAFAGLILSGAHPPAKQAQTASSAEEQKVAATQSPEPIETATPPYRPYSAYNPDPCYNAKNHDAADLCAQWRAAIAAEKATHEARRASNLSVIAALLSSLTIGGLVWTIWQGHQGLERAREANQISRDTAYESNRPWLTFSISMDSDPIVSSDKIAFSVKLKIKNVGLSPATTVLFEHKVFNTFRKIDPNNFIDSDYEDAKSTEKVGFIITPNETTKRTIHIEIPKEDVGMKPSSTRGALHPMIVVSVCYRAATDSRLRGQSAKGFIIGELAQWANAIGSDKSVFAVADSQGQYSLNISSLEVRDAYEIGVAR